MHMRGGVTWWCDSSKQHIQCGFLHPVVVHSQVAVLVLAFFGYVTLWMSVLADVGSSLLVILHGLSVLSFQVRATTNSSKCTSVHRKQFHWLV